MDTSRNGTMTVIIPAYNEAENISIAAETVSNILQNAAIPYKLLFVDDGSSDETWAQIQLASNKYSHVAGLHFSRNFGKEGAIAAGLCNAKTDCVAVMDCDLQHPPEKLVEMYRLWQTGIDVIEGIKADRGKESLFHRFASHGFYRIISKLSDLDLENTSDFKLLDQKVVKIIREMPERNAFFRATTFWVGFRHATVSYEVQERIAGTSKWSGGKLIQYALNNIAAFSSTPMKMVLYLGVFMLIFDFIFGMIAFVQKIMGIALSGFTTIILLQVFIGAVMIISIGTIGFYIARIYTEIQGRPRFIISDSCGEDEDEYRAVG